MFLFLGHVLYRCCAKVVLDVSYTKKVLPETKARLKSTVQSCGELIGDSDKFQSVCLNVASKVEQPWYSSLLTKVIGTGAKCPSVLEVKPEGKTAVVAIACVLT